MCADHIHCHFSYLVSYNDSKTAATLQSVGYCPTCRMCLTYHMQSSKFHIHMFMLTENMVEHWTTACSLHINDRHVTATIYSHYLGAKLQLPSSKNMNVDTTQWSTSTLKQSDYRVVECKLSRMMDRSK